MNVTIKSTPSRLILNPIKPSDRLAIDFPGVMNGRGAEAKAAQNIINNDILSHARIGERVTRINEMPIMNINAGRIKP